MTKDYYAILGVGKDATGDEINRSYKRNVMKWHPDRWSKRPGAEQKMAEEKLRSNNSLGGNGDLYYMFTLNEDPGGKFGLDGSNMRDIYSTIEVSVFDCLVGCEKTVRTIDGKALRLDIPRGTGDGHEFTLGKHGMRLSDGSAGNFIVKVEMTIPEIDDRKIEKIKKILEEK